MTNSNKSSKTLNKSLVTETLLQACSPNNATVLQRQQTQQTSTCVRNSSSYGGWCSPACRVIGRRLKRNLGERCPWDNISPHSTFQDLRPLKTYTYVALAIPLPSIAHRQRLRNINTAGTKHQGPAVLQAIQEESTTFLTKTERQLTLAHQQAILLRSFIEDTTAGVTKARDSRFPRSPVGLKRVILCQAQKTHKSKRGVCCGFHGELELRKLSVVADIDTRVSGSSRASRLHVALKICTRQLGFPDNAELLMRMARYARNTSYEA